MDDRDFKHQNKDRLCYCCDILQTTKNDIQELVIGDRGYGSIINDSDPDYIIQLCSKCIKYINPEWFTEEPEIEHDYIYNYKHEEEILTFLNSWILENQEYVSNILGQAEMERQDWIDYRRGTLSDNKLEFYGMITSRQAKEYKEKFPTCNHPINIDGIYKCDDECRCPHGAMGDYNQVIYKEDTPVYECSCRNCCDCEHYVERFEPIKTMDYNQFRRYKIYFHAKSDYLKLKDEFEK